MSAELVDRIADADLVLIGIGEEFEIKNSEIEKEDGCQAVLKRKKCYEQLKSLIEDKNYFIVSLCVDGIIHDVGLDSDRIVEPCGSLRKLQCSDKCTSDIYEPDLSLLKKIKAMIEGKCNENEIELPACPKCGKPLAFNTILAENYAEEGYLDKWGLYTKWLQGTVNRKICLLELGVGMRFPTVIRWPFEKITYYNQKAMLFRVHSRLYQIAEKVKDRSIGIKAEPVEFLIELSNEI